MFSAEAKKLLRELAQRDGVSQAAVLEKLIRAEANFGKSVDEAMQSVILGWQESHGGKP